MGLDMHAFATAATIKAETDFPAEPDTEIAYWRKHEDLHDWFGQLYRAKGGISESFYCVTVALAPEDLDQLAADVKSGALSLGTGVFPGHTIDDAIEDVMTFIGKARAVLADGKSVFYVSW